MLIVAFVVICVLLAVLLYAEDRKNTALAEQNGKVKAELESALARTPDAADNKLSFNSIADTLAGAGYLPDKGENILHFSALGNKWAILTDRLPLVSIYLTFFASTKDWNPDLLWEAAHHISDDMVMVKAFITPEEENKDEFQINFLIAALDNSLSFKENLPTYINVMMEASGRLRQIYADLQSRQSAVQHPTPGGVAS